MNIENILCEVIVLVVTDINSVCDRYVMCRCVIRYLNNV